MPPRRICQYKEMEKGRGGADRTVKAASPRRVVARVRKLTIFAVVGIDGYCFDDWLELCCTGGRLLLLVVVMS